jgi:Spy/CpxP family protein refolding chaperone
MKLKNYLGIFLLLVAGCISTAIAQDGRPADPPPQQIKGLRDNHADMLHQLGLSEDQLQQIRKLHAAKRPLMDAAQKRLREATKALNDAIYADQVNDADIQIRLKDRQAAQAEVEKLRFMTELAVRRILTPEQLVRFRELRQRFEDMRDHGSRGGMKHSPESQTPAPQN